MTKNKITYKIGNILDAPEKIICQQVNCQKTMGSGLAGQIIKKYPDIKRSYLTYCDTYTKTSPKDLLGRVHFYYAPDGKIIANLFGQLYYGRCGIQYTDYDALGQALVGVGIEMKRRRFTVAIPQGIGCGLAGGDWTIVKAMIESYNSVVNDYTSVYTLPMT